MKCWIIFLALVYLQLLCPGALLQAQTELPRETIINWVGGSWRKTSVMVRYGKLYGLVEGGLVVGSPESRSFAIFTTADGLASAPPNKAYIDDTGFVWTLCRHVRDWLPWQVFDGLRWAGVGDCPNVCAFVDNRYGLWSRSATKLVYFQLSPPGSAKSTE